jgi:hypothetical protein
MAAFPPASDNNGEGSAQSMAGDRSVAPLRALRRFARAREAPRTPLARCELCSEPILAEHRHMLELGRRVVICACHACILLFGKEGAAGGKYRVIPGRYLVLEDFQMTDAQWEELMIPVNMLYIFRTAMDGAQERSLAFYPSPAGAIESLLSLESWEMLVVDNPVLRDLEPDVEALLINRVGDRRMYYIVPIDACFQLVGLIRISWKGLGGGEEVWKAIGDFFADLRSKSGPVVERRA